MVKDGPGLIPDEVRTALEVAAYKLQLDGFDAVRIKDDSCAGYLETTWDSHMIGSRGGILFKAQIETDEGAYFVNFLLAEKDLERGAEILRQFEDQELHTRWGVAQGEIELAALYEFLGQQPGPTSLQ